MNNLGYSVKAIRKASTHLTEEPIKSDALHLTIKVFKTAYYILLAVY